MSKIIQFESSGKWPFPVEVVGESRYRENFKKIFKRVPKKGVHKKLPARLVLEDSNVYDPNAVSVEIDGQKVGYLSRDAAEIYHRLLRQANLGNVMGECEAYVVGGFEKDDGSKADFGVRLDLDLGNLRVSGEDVSGPGTKISWAEAAPKKKRQIGGRTLAWIVIAILFTCTCLGCYISSMSN